MKRLHDTVLCSMLLIVGFAAEAIAAGTFYVDRNNPSCSDAGPGTPAIPYCSILAAAAAQGGPATTIRVSPGIYREQITVPASGSAGSPFVFQATGPGVVIDGAEDFSAPGLWTNVGGDVWRASTVTWPPEQVIADGARLDSASVALPNIPLHSYAYDGTSPNPGLYVNVGAGNPGSHNVFVGLRQNGFRITTRSYVTVDGFEIKRSERVGIVALTGSTNCSILNNTVTYAGTIGIQANSGSAFLIHRNRVSLSNDHGISLLGGVTGSTVSENESFQNARPAARAANGIILFGSSDNRLERNRTHDNQDTGIQVNNASNNVISIQNRSWNNGNHGFDFLNSSGAVHVGDVAWGNNDDGFSTEGNSPGAHFHDCIAVDNGLTTSGRNLLVDAASSVGFVGDYNIFFNSSAPNRITFNGVIYTTLAAYVAGTGQDTHSTEASPRFVNPGAGDFHLLAGSPAIDAGTSGVAEWPTTDAEGNARADDPATPNTGAGGPVLFADRGALEFQPTVIPPPSGNNLCGNPSFEQSTNGWEPWHGSTIARVDGGYEGAKALLVSGPSGSEFGINDTPNWVRNAHAGVRYQFSAYLRLVSGNGVGRLKVREYLNGSSRGRSVYSAPLTLTSAWTKLTVERVTTVEGASLDLQIYQEPPAVAVATEAVQATQAFLVDLVEIRIVSPGPPGNTPPNAALTVLPSSGPAPLAVTANASGSTDPGGSIASYRFDFGDGTIVGPQPGATAPHTYANGTWTATVTVTDNGGLTATASATVTAGSGSGGTSACTNPSFLTSTDGWESYGGSHIRWVASGNLDAGSVEITGPSNTDEFGINDHPNCVAVTGPAGTRYRHSAWVRSASGTGKAKLRVREYRNGVRLGDNVYSEAKTLSPGWQKLELERVTLGSGTSLDLQVLDLPAGPGEVFQVDNVVIAQAVPTPLTPDEQSLRPGVLRFAAVVAPNPARNNGNLDFSTTREGPVRIRIFDTAGRLVRSPLDEGRMPAGQHRVSLAGSGKGPLPAGVYLYQLRAGEGTLKGRFLVID